MTDETKRLRELHKKATLGTWCWEDNPPTIYAARDAGHHGLNLFGRLEPDPNGANNLNLIVETINALPALLDTIEAQAAEIERLRKGLGLIAEGSTEWMDGYIEDPVLLFMKYAASLLEANDE